MTLFNAIKKAKRKKGQKVAKTMKKGDEEMNISIYCEPKYYKMIPYLFNPHKGSVREMAPHFHREITCWHCLIFVATKYKNKVEVCSI